MITNANKFQLYHALDLLNCEVYNGNLTFRSIDQVSKNRVHFTLTVNSTSDNADGWKYSPHSKRKVHAAGWKAHGDFFNVLFHFYPETWVKSSLHKKKITIDNPYPKVIINIGWGCKDFLSNYDYYSDFQAHLEKMTKLINTFYYTVDDLQDDRYDLITDREGVNATLDMIGRSDLKDKYEFIIADLGNGEFREVYGSMSSVPYLDNEVDRLF